MGRRSLIGTLAVGAMALAVAAVGAPASAAPSGVDVSLVGVGIVGGSGGQAGGPDYADWSLTGVAAGESPLVGTMTMNFAHAEPCGDLVSFALSGVGGSISGGAFGDCTGVATLLGSATLSALITSATGSFAGLAGHSGALTLDVSPNNPVSSLLLANNPDPVPGTSPSAMVGSLTVNP